MLKIEGVIGLKRAVFLDRDGVINEVLTDRVKFVNEPNQLYFLPGVEEAIKSLNEYFDYVFVVTNQGGIGLVYMKEKKQKKSNTDHLFTLFPQFVRRIIFLC